MSRNPESSTKSPATYRPRRSCGKVSAKYMMAHPVSRMVLLARRVFLRPKRSDRRPPDTRPHMLKSCMMLTVEQIEGVIINRLKW